MQTSIAQMVALTCFGNGAISGKSVSTFFSGNSTCQFCESVRFTAGGKDANGAACSVTVAESPDQWIAGLAGRGIRGLKLRQEPRGNHPIRDYQSAGFVGGGKIWKLEALRRDGASEFWLSKWEVGDRNAPDRRIWNVTYGLAQIGKTEPLALRPEQDIADDLRSSLSEIKEFSRRHANGAFIDYFDRGSNALDNPAADLGYHKDLFPPGSLSAPSQSLLQCAQCAWVFGGMGSWNDQGFQGDLESEFERVSVRLFDLLNEAIAAAASASFPAASS
jgi:hypothetical protein